MCRCSFSGVVAEVHVHIDQPGHEVFAGAVDREGAPGCRNGAGSTDARDDSALDNDGLLCNHTFAVHRHDVHVCEHDGCVLRLHEGGSSEKEVCDGHEALTIPGMQRSYVSL
jgi:hypothetical protein